MSQVLQVDELADEEVLSQFGCRKETETIEPPFRKRPRPRDLEADPPGLSLLRGRLTPLDAAQAVRGRKELVMGADGVRHTTSGKLRDAGFVVIHTPKKAKLGHVTVSFPSDWGEDTDNMFDSCFDEPMYVDGGAV